MSRRSYSSAKPPWIWLLFLAGAICAGGYYFLSSGKGPLRTAQALDAVLYASSAGSLRGNTYKLDARVDNMLAVSPAEGRLISVRVKQGSAILPLLVTKEFNSVNLQKEQHYLFLVEVGEKGLLHTKLVNKP
jgi:hypothetical protein